MLLMVHINSIKKGDRDAFRESVLIILVEDETPCRRNPKYFGITLDVGKPLASTSKFPVVLEKLFAH